MVDLIIQNGTVVTPTGSFRAEIAVKDGKIGLSGAKGLCPKPRKPGCERASCPSGSDRRSCPFPGPGMTYKEDFETGSRAAAFGGVTTIFDMPNTAPPLTDVKNLDEKVALVKGRSYVDFGLYAAVTDSNVDQLKPLGEAGIGGFKVFMGETTGYIRCPDDGLIYEAFQRIRETGRRSEPMPKTTLSFSI